MSDTTDQPATVAPKVGYRNPPAATRFKPGQSGNPKGKPKGAKSMKTVITKLANGKVIVKVSGVPIKMSNLEASTALLNAKASQGDLKALLSLIALYKEFLPTDAEMAIALPQPTAEDLAVLSSKTKLLELIEAASK